MNMQQQIHVSYSDRARKGDHRALAIVAIAAVVLLLLNLLVALLPASLTQADTTENELYSISPVTRRFLRALDEDVTVYVICEGGMAELMPRALLDRYEAASRHVKVKIVDPVADAEFLADYGSVASMTNYSMVIESDRRYSIIDYGNCQYYYVEGLGYLLPDEYSSYYSYYYGYFDQIKETYGIDLTAVTPCLALESALTQAIEYVTAPVIPTLHVLKDSAPMGSYLTDMIAMMQPEYATLALDGTASVPTHAVPLLIYAPEQDISAQTAQSIIAYLQNGGSVMLVTSPESTSMTNLMSVPAAFGLAPVEGVLCEGNANNFDGEATRLVPTVNAEHDVTYSLVNGGYGAPILPDAHGIVADATLPEGVSVTNLFTTSNTAYTIAADGSEVNVGTVAVGVAAENTTTGAKLFWLPSADALSDALITAEGTKASAPYYTTMAMLWQSEPYESTLDAIEPVDVSQDVVLLDAPTVIAWSVFLVLLVPLAVLVPGIVVRIKRNRK